MEQWKIQRNRTACKKPGCPLAGETEFYAVLQLPECVRIERCATCFEELKHASDEMPFHWKVRRQLDGSKTPMLDLESLRTLFDRLGEMEASPAMGESSSPESVSIAEAESIEAAAPDAEAAESDEPQNTAGLRYLVALLLLRKRRLKMVDPKTPEQEAADLLVVDPKIAEMEPVALSAPEFDPDRLGNLREELMAAIGEEPTTTATAEAES